MASLGETTSRGPQAKKRKSEPKRNRTPAIGLGNQDATTTPWDQHIGKEWREKIQEGSGLTPQENIKEKCPKCSTELSAIKVSTTSRAVLFLCPSCGGKRSKILTKEGYGDEKQKFNYRYSPTSLYGKTFAAEAKPLNSPDSDY